jgi:hypothetical protein
MNFILYCDEQILVVTNYNLHLLLNEWFHNLVKKNITALHLLVTL